MPTDEANPWDEPGDEVDATTAPTPAPTLAKGAADPDEAAPGGPAADASADGTSTDAATPDDSDAERRRVLVIAAVAFVLIAGIGFFLTQGGDDDADADTTASTTTAAGQPGATDGEAGGSVTIAGTADSFNRDDSDDGLGALPSGAEWVVQSGTWGIRSGEVAVLQPDPERRNTVFVGTGYPDPQAQVRLTTIANGAGMVFRYQGECNYWSVYAVPEFATWNVEKVVDCARVGGGGPDTQVFRAIPQAPTGDGTTVGVVLDGEQVQIVLNGRVATTFEDPHLAGVGRVGLTARGPESGDARFDDFIAGGPGGEGVVGPATGGQGAGDGGDDEAPADGGDAPSTTAGG